MKHRANWAARAFCPALIAVFGLISVNESRGQRVEVPPQSAIINSAISKAWADNKLVPAKRCSDNEFIRRVFLDVVGRIPSSEEVKDFVERDQSAHKRASLIHRLLNADEYKLKGIEGKPIVFEYSREYTEHWADVWTVWTMTRGGTNELYHNQMRLWLEKQLANNTPYDQMVRSMLTATGKGNSNGAVNFIMAHLGEANPKDKHDADGPFDAIPITSRVTRLFLGIQTQCTQCHDHPFNPEWGQENFWGVNAFFRTTDRDMTPAAPEGTGKKKGMEALPVTLTDNPQYNPNLLTYYERRTGVLMAIKPTFLPNLADLEKDKSERVKKPLPSDGSKSRREYLADYVVSHDNFAKAYVNRMWAHFFGRGLNEQAAADDFGGHNKLVHPEMLEQLGQEFSKYKYDSKLLIEWICNSDVYNQSYVPANKEMSDPKYDAYFVHMPLKAMSPEVLFNALGTAVRADAAVDKEARKAAREAWMRKLVNNFGDDEGNEMTFNGTIVQALLMMNGKELNDEIKRSDGVVARIIAKRLSPEKAVEELYLTALARKPSSTTLLQSESIDPKTKKKIVAAKGSTEAAFVNFFANNMYKLPHTGKGPSPYEQYLQDLFWTLLNTSEFMLNH